MKKERLFCLIFGVLLPISLHAQILLKGYKCRFYKDQWPYNEAFFVTKNDTFHFELYAKSVWAAVVNDSREEELKVGLEFCFGSKKYSKTNDSLYISTGKGKNGIYYYMVYIPENIICLSVRSAKNDSLFDKHSSWLLNQVRAARKSKKDMYFVNERNQSCQNPNYPLQ